jgi:hypothetical protein
MNAQTCVCGHGFPHATRTVGMRLGQYACDSESGRQSSCAGAQPHSHTREKSTQANRLRSSTSAALPTRIQPRIGRVASHLGIRRINSLPHRSVLTAPGQSQLGHSTKDERAQHPKASTRIDQREVPAGLWPRCCGCRASPCCTAAAAIVACDRTSDLQMFYSLLHYAHCSNSGCPAHCKRSYP